MISVLLDGMRNAVCVGFGNGHYGEFSEIDQKRLRDVFRMIGSPPNGIAKELSTWPNVVEGKQLRCRVNDVADKYSDSIFQDRVQAFTPFLADWLSDVDSDLAGALVQWAAGTSKDSPFTRKLGTETSNLVNWFIRNDYWLDALELSSADTAAFHLQRRATYLQLSGCYFASNDQSRAEKLETLAFQTAVQEREIGRSTDMLDIAKAEARYFAVKSDWVNASKTCDQCDGLGRVIIASELIPRLSASARRKLPQTPQCPQLSDEAFRQLVLTQDSTK